MSPLHGGVDRNIAGLARRAALYRRPFTGAWIETITRRQDRPCALVAPSRGRGSKLPGSILSDIMRGRPFTGAWIETPQTSISLFRPGRRPFTGAWIETAGRNRLRVRLWSPLHGGVDRNVLARTTAKTRRRRPFTGAWIETPALAPADRHRSVAPSRGRGSKPPGRAGEGRLTGVAPSRGRGSKHL